MSDARSRKTAAGKNKHSEGMQQKTTGDKAAAVEVIEPRAEEGVMSTAEAIQSLCKDIPNLKNELKQELKDFKKKHMNQK